MLPFFNKKGIIFEMCSQTICQTGMALGETFSNSSIFLKICIVLMPLQTLLYVTGFSTEYWIHKTVSSVNNSGNFYDGLWKVQSCFMNQCVTADIQNVEGNTICPNGLFVYPLFRSRVRKFRCSWLQSFGLPSKSLNRDLYRVIPRVTLSHLKVCPNLVAFGVQWTHCLTSIPSVSWSMFGLFRAVLCCPTGICTLQRLSIFNAFDDIVITIDF